METALNTPKVSFEDFYEVPDLKFDIDKLREGEIHDKRALDQEVSSTLAV